MHYQELAKGVRHYKESEGGNETMCEAVENYAKEYAKEYSEEKVIEATAVAVKKLMKNANYTLEQAFATLEIPNDNKSLIIERLSDMES